MTDGDSTAPQAPARAQFAADPAVTLIRLDGKDGAVTFAAVRSADAVAVLAEMGDAEDLDTDTVPWEALPGIQPLAVTEMRSRPRRSIAVIGTAVGGEWTSWYLPVTAPTVPAA
jgi:hypothetical protein